MGWGEDRLPVMTCDPVGHIDIAERLGVKPGTVRSWDLPAPAWTVSGRPAWNWPDVEAWHRTRVVGKPGRPARLQRVKEAAE